MVPHSTQPSTLPIASLKGGVQGDMAVLQSALTRLELDDRRAARVSVAAVLPLISQAQDVRASSPAEVQASLKAAADAYGDLATPQVSPPCWRPVCVCVCVCVCVGKGGGCVCVGGGGRMCTCV